MRLTNRFISPFSVHPAAQQIEVINAAIDIDPLTAYHCASIDASAIRLSPRYPGSSA